MFSIFVLIEGVAQSIRSQDEAEKKHLAHTYIQVVELLLTVSDKKTAVVCELRHELTNDNFDKVIEKFTSIDRLCRSILTHCPKTTSKNAVTDVTQNLQVVLDEIRVMSSALNIKNKVDENKSK